MSTVNIITLIAIILFARLGMRLLYKYRKLKKEEKHKKDKNDTPKEHE